MDRKNQSLVDRFKLKYSDELISPERVRRKFSPAFKSDLLLALDESDLTQKQFAEAIGISLSVISGCRRKFIPPEGSSSNSPQSFQQIKIENPGRIPIGQIYLQSPSGFQVHGLNLSQVSDLLRTL